MNTSDPRFPAVKELTAYWLAHPNASDTLEGICQWWLVDGSLVITDVGDALDWLIANGIVQVTRAGDGRCHYRLADQQKASQC